MLCLKMSQEASAGGKALGGGGAKGGSTLDLVSMGLMAVGAAKPNDPGERHGCLAMEGGGGLAAMLMSLCLDMAA